MIDLPRRQERAKERDRKIPRRQNRHDKRPYTGRADKTEIITLHERDHNSNTNTR
jgi:hypothetical protein